MFYSWKDIIIRADFSEINIIFDDIIILTTCVLI